MMMNESAKKDLTSYVKTTIQSAIALFLVILLAISAAWAFDMTRLMEPLVGGLIGALFACANLFALGFAFYALSIKKAKRWAILWPLATFIAMCVMAFFMAIYSSDHVFGFALGLTAPVVFGATIVFGSSKPA